MLSVKTRLEFFFQNLEELKDHINSYEEKQRGFSLFKKMYITLNSRSREQSQLDENVYKNPTRFRHLVRKPQRRWFCYLAYSCIIFVQ